MLLIGKARPAITVPSSLPAKKAEVIARAAIAIILFVAAFALVARATGVPLLMSAVPLEPILALALFCLGGALLLVGSEEGLRREIGKALGAVVAVVAASMAGDRALGMDLGLGTLFGAGADSLPVSFTSALELALLGGALVATEFESFPRHRLSDLLALAALFVLLWIGLDSRYGSSGVGDPDARLEVHADALFALAAAALLCTRSEAGTLGAIVDALQRSTLARRWLPAAVALPSFAGLVAVVLHHNGWIDVAEAISLLVGGAIAVPSVWMLASRSGPERRAVQSADEAAAQLAREVAAREPERPRVHYLQLLHDLDSIAWEADPATGQLKFASPRMRSLLSAAADVSPAETEFWTRIAHAPDRACVASTLSTAAMESRECELEFRASTAAGTRFLRARFYPVHEGSPPRWARGVVFDLTDAKGRDRFVAAQTDVARVLDGSPSVAIALPRLLGVLGQALEWDAGAAWTLDRSLGALRCVESWQASPDIAVELVSASRGETCRRGEDLPGRVWANGVAAWSAALGRESKSRRAAGAAADGVKSAVGFPIRARGEVLGVAELFSRNDEPPDENVSAFLSAVGDLIGIFIDHRRTEERQREESAALEAVNKLAPMLSGKLDVDQVIQELTDAATRLASAASGTFFYHSPGSEGDGYRSYTSTAAPRDSFGLAVPRPAGFPTRLFSSDGPLRIDDARRGASTSWSESPLPGAPIASYLAVPVVSRSGRVLGGLALSHPDPGVFTDREERIVLAIAAQAAVAIDNAEIYATERQARQAAEAASRAKDEFLAMLGHELRNPIGAIRNSVDTLSAAYGRNGDAAGEMLTAIISRQTETLAQLVDDLLDVTRLISGKMRLRKRVVDLSEFTGRALEALCAGGRAGQHSVRFDGEPLFVDGDPVRLEQIVTNLVDNALKYTPPGGEIAIAVERTGEVAQLRVRDNGQGIDPELLPRIFDLFAQGRQSLDRPHGGLGIGLTLVRRLAELHGGTVEVESAGCGRGSEFRVRLPARAPSEGAAVEEAPGPRWMTPRHVLIAEDHADSRESLRLLLEASGHRVDVARGGDDAVELALSGSPELALIDIGLPGLDGYDVAREIRASDTSDSIYLVALTGYGQPLDRRRALRCGFNEHVVKPLTREKLLRLMATLDSPDRRVAS